MKTFRTEIKIEPAPKPIDYDAHLFFMGSCFASNIGDFFATHSLNTLVNPFGVLYNPFSIANSLERLLNNQTFAKADLLVQNGYYHTFYHHSQFNAETEHEFLSVANAAVEKGVKFLKQTNVLVFTFGTAWVYQHKELEVIVSNCHKYPAASFHRFRLSVNEIVDRYRKLLMDIQAINPSVQFIFTVSPVRHWKDGAHGNQLSKSTLLLAIDELVKDFSSSAHYFPSYEILLDELRDYRFFSDDMLHPSDQAVGFIREKFIASQYTTEGRAFINKVDKLFKAASHRPFNPNAEAHLRFVKKHIEKVEALQKEYGNVNLSTLKERFAVQLK